MKFRGDQLATARHAAGYHSAEAFGAAIGVSGQAVRTWEGGQHAPSEVNLARIVEITGRPVGYFYGEQNASVETADLVRQLQVLLGPGGAAMIDGGLATVPLYDRVTAGSGGVADSTPTEYRHIPSAWIPAGQEGDCYLVRATGDSMIDAGIMEGDLLFICSAVPVHDGDIALIEIDGEEIVVKRVWHEAEDLLLVSENRGVAPRRVRDARIIGRVMWWRHDAE